MPSLLRSARLRVIAAVGVVALVVVNARARIRRARPLRPTTRPSSTTSAPRSPTPAIPGASIAVDPRWAAVAGPGRRRRGRERPPGHAGHPVRHRLAVEVAHRARDPAAGRRGRRSSSTRRSRATCRASGPPPRITTPITVREALSQTSGLPGSAIDLSSPVVDHRGPGRLPCDGRAGQRARRAIRLFERQLRRPRGGHRGGHRPGLPGGDADPRVRTARDDPHDGRSRRRPRARPGRRSSPVVRAADGVAAALPERISRRPASSPRPRETWRARSRCSWPAGRPTAERFLSPAGVAALTTGAAPTGVGDARYAMGWVDTTHDGLRTIAHDGSTTDMAAVQVIAPASRDGVIVLADAQSIPYEVLGKIDMIGLGALDHMLGRQADGTLERFYPIVDVVLLVLLAAMVRGHGPPRSPGPRPPALGSPRPGRAAWARSPSTATSTWSSRSCCCYESRRSSRLPGPSWSAPMSASSSPS